MSHRGSPTTSETRPPEAFRSEEDSLSTQRIEAFSDGVFSIAITLLVLELQLPHSGDPSAAFPLTRQLLDLWPAYLGYVMSFAMIGIYWANHHAIFKLYTGTDHTFNLLNLFFLMSISFLPFPASVLSSHMRMGGNANTAVMFYAFGLLLPALGFGLMWMYASAGHRLIPANLDPAFVTRLRIQFLASAAIYLGAIVMSYWLPMVGLIICIALTLLYLAPPKRPQLVDRVRSLPPDP